MPQQTEQTQEALEDFKTVINKLHYLVNHAGIDNSIIRTEVRDYVDEVTIAFNTYIKTLVR